MASVPPLLKLPEMIRRTLFLSISAACATLPLGLSVGAQAKPAAAPARAAAKGASVLEPAVTARMMAELNRLSAREGKKVSQTLADPLSDRELGVLKLLAAGCSNKEIGSRLNITEGTVKNHMTNVLGKLGVLDRTQAALRAREMGLI